MDRAAAADEVPGLGVSLGFGFRGGLFFASLFMGTLVGALFAGLINLAANDAVIDVTSASLAGMAALAAAVVGAPMTMAMLVLEGTHDFVLASAVMAAVLVSGTVTRQAFGYSFSTGASHLRGGTITSARCRLDRRHDRRPDDAARANTLDAATRVEDARKRFPLGSATRVALLDAAGHYAGIVPVAASMPMAPGRTRLSAISPTAAAWPSPPVPTCLR
jgi:CIC family chloride channel protein